MQRAMPALRKGRPGIWRPAMPEICGRRRLFSLLRYVTGARPQSRTRTLLGIRTNTAGEARRSLEVIAQQWDHALMKLQRAVERWLRDRRQRRSNAASACIGQ
jgi:hypothetical protein